MGSGAAAARQGLQQTRPGAPALHVYRRARKERRPVKLPSRIASRRNHGSAVVVMIVLLGLMLIFVFANLKTLHFMSRELKLIEKRQVQRLSATARATNQHPQARTNATPSARLSPRSQRKLRKNERPSQTDKRMDLATAIQISLRAFAWGILGFFPVVGLLPGFFALSCWNRVRRSSATNGIPLLAT